MFPAESKISLPSGASAIARSPRKLYRMFSVHEPCATVGGTNWKTVPSPYRPPPICGAGQKNIRKKRKAPTFVGASEIESELRNLANDQTNPEGRARLTRRLIMDLIFIFIFKAQYSMASVQLTSNMLAANCAASVFSRLRPERRTHFAYLKSVANHACY